MLYAGSWMRLPIWGSDSAGAVLPRLRVPRGGARVDPVAPSWRRRPLPAGVGGAVCGVLAVCSVLLASCAASPSQEERESWRCERTADGNDWACSEQRVGRRAAVPAAESRPIIRAEATGEAVAAEQLSGATPPPVTNVTSMKNDGGPARWRETLPALSADAVRMPPGPEASLGGAARPAPPEPEPVFARWEKQATEATAALKERQVSPGSSSEARKLPAGTPPQPSAAGSTAIPDHSADRGGPRYTVQIGAFGTDRDARAYIARHDLGALPLAVTRETRGKREYSLITFGSFATVKAATTAWYDSVGPRHLDVWVRPVRFASPAALEIAPGPAAAEKY